MMRRLIGDDAFFNGIRRFYRDWRFKKAGTDDFRVAMEAESPIKLQRFFDRWIFGTALPQLRVTSKIDQSGTFGVVRIEQIGDVFDLPYTVTVQYHGRQDRGRDHSCLGRRRRTQDHVQRPDQAPRYQGRPDTGEHSQVGAQASGARPQKRPLCSVRWLLLRPKARGLWP